MRERASIKIDRNIEMNVLSLFFLIFSRYTHTHSHPHPQTLKVKHKKRHQQRKERSTLFIVFILCGALWLCVLLRFCWRYFVLLFALRRRNKDKRECEEREREKINITRLPLTKNEKNISVNDSLFCLSNSFQRKDDDV